MSDNQATPRENQDIGKRMAELLRNSKHEEQHRRDQRMALPQNTHVYMETVETSKNKEKKSDKDGSTRILCEYGGKLPKRTLVLCESDNS